MRHLITAILLFSGLAISSPATAAPLLQYSQDGKTYIPFNVVTGRERAANYYDYYNYTGHPDFGVVQGVTTAAFYYDAKRDALSLMLISGSGADTGKVSYAFHNLPKTTFLNLCDDPGEFGYGTGTADALALFNWSQQTDGLVFSGLENQDLAMKIQIKPYVSVSGLRMATANNTFITLDLNKPLYVATQSINVGGTNPPPVPEPGTPSLCATALLGLLKRRSR